jgi:Spy/CpxP family protein refolding chaperone
MIKKSLPFLAAVSLIFTAVQAQPNRPQMQQQKQMQGKKKSKSNKAIFLIQRGLPHYTMILMKLWDNPKLALTPKQKTELEIIRNRTIQGVMELKPQIQQLRKKIIQAARTGTEPKTLYADIDRLAKLKADATKVHLNCIYETQRILTPEQIAFIDNFLKQKRKKRQ